MPNHPSKTINISFLTQFSAFISQRGGEVGMTPDFKQEI
jgi:hypothetical protein